MKKGSLQDGLVYHAGFPNAAEDQRIAALSLDSLVVQHRASTFYWRLEEAIEELHWPAGTIVVVDRALAPHHNDRVVAVVDESFVVRLYEKRESGGPRLLKPDGSHEDGASITLWGVVTYIVQGMR